MFDKLIESNSAAADFRIRRKYFVLSALVVGTLVLAGVVASIYASDIGLGTDQFELATMLAPVAQPENQPEPPQPQRQTTRQTSQQPSDSPVPTRQVNMARVEEQQPTPESISTVPNSQMSRPYGDYKIGSVDSGPVGAGPVGLNPSSDGKTGTSGPSGSIKETESSTQAEVKQPPPPPVKAVTKSLGVINGKATSLPVPTYPTAAISLNVQGSVDVQVMIDETGKVISAKAVNGHPLLRGPAERAAFGARFSPTKLSDVPVKVTGVIVYNFKRN
jgi:TonB family protein